MFADPICNQVSVLGRLEDTKRRKDYNNWSFIHEVHILAGLHRLEVIIVDHITFE
jgi:hypothetical protein